MHHVVEEHETCQEEKVDRPQAMELLAKKDFHAPCC